MKRVVNQKSFQQNESSTKKIVDDKIFFSTMWSTKSLVDEAIFVFLPDCYDGHWKIAPMYLPTILTKKKV